MSNVGMGVLLNKLGGGNKNAPEKYYGKKISAAEIKDDKFYLDFTDGTKITILDDGQSCCESRYMTCDDDLSFLVGKTLTKIETKDGTQSAPEDGYVDHEICFLDISTPDGSIQFATHNEHNGYYGGFTLEIIERD